MDQFSTPDRRFGLYIHFPWCRSRCDYCDFPIIVPTRTRTIDHQGYADVILDELDNKRHLFSTELSSLYIGGGTPSLWHHAALASLLRKIDQRFGLPSEVTLEANPTDCIPVNLEAWKRMGITRLSIGLQSFDPQTLVTLGRDHRMGHAQSAVINAATAGFDNYTVDLIIGAPGSDASATAAWLVDFGVPHISTYELTIEPGTPLAAQQARGQFTQTDEADVTKALHAIDSQLTAAGYEHYEVSSFALGGARSQHNQSYWRGISYLGVGMGAASYVRLPDDSAIRFANARTMRDYLGGRLRDVDFISCANNRTDLAWLGMRTSDGIPMRWASENFQQWLLKNGLATRGTEHLHPTLRGMLMHNQIAAKVSEPGNILHS